MFKLSHKTENYASHQPILAAYVNKVRNGKIIEYGAGDYSTGLLHEICQRNNNTLITIESDEAWLAKVKAQYEGFHWHKYVYVKEYAELLDIEHDFSCDVAFIDSATWGSRLFCLQETLRTKFYAIIIHDCDFLKGHLKYTACIKPELRTVHNTLWPPTMVLGYPTDINYELEEV
jgi:hypothetical protein